MINDESNKCHYFAVKNLPELNSSGWNYNKRKNQVILLMINDESNKCHYFAVKNLSELNSSGWLRGKKETIISGDNDFENTLHDALNYETIEKIPQRISKLNPYINKYNWKGIKFLAEPEEWKKFEQNNKAIALNVLHIPHNTKTSVAYRSEYNSKCRKQVILLMINNGKKYHYLAATNLSALLQGNSSNHEGDFFCLNCFS